MKKHLKFNKKHNNIIKSKIFLKILPLLITSAMLGGCQKEEEFGYESLILEIKNYYTSDAPTGTPEGIAPTGGNANSEWEYMGTDIQDEPTLSAWKNSYKKYEDFNKYTDGKEANVAGQVMSGNSRYAVVTLYIYRSKKQLADTLKQNAR